MAGVRRAKRNIQRPTGRDSIRTGCNAGGTITSSQQVCANSRRIWVSLGQGDSLYGAKNNFKDYGNSYNEQFRDDSFRVRHVDGDLLQPKGSYSWTPIKVPEIGLSPVNKIIAGDNPWHANRSATNPKDMWHNYKGQRRENILFGDGHVEFFKFPIEMDEWITSPAPDRNFLWW